VKLDNKFASYVVEKNKHYKHGLALQCQWRDTE
jgi:hypothetical protein